MPGARKAQSRPCVCMPEHRDHRNFTRGLRLPFDYTLAEEETTLIVTSLSNCAGTGINLPFKAASYRNKNDSSDLVICTITNL